MKFNVDEYRVHREHSDGFCRKCQEITAVGGVEPDARNYPCEVCGEPEVFGIEEALLMGLVGLGEG